MLIIDKIIKQTIFAPISCDVTFMRTFVYFAYCSFLFTCYFLLSDK